MLLDSLLAQLPLIAALLLELHESFMWGQFKVLLWKGAFFPADHSEGLLRYFVHIVHRFYCKRIYLFPELMKILASSPVYFNCA